MIYKVSLFSVDSSNIQMQEIQQKSRKGMLLSQALFSSGANIILVILQIEVPFMGSRICTADIPPDFQPQTMQEVFAYDQKQASIVHTRPLICRDPEKQIILEKYSLLLKQKKSLFKDPTMSTDPIILKSRKNQLKCTYERPFKFLNEVTKGDPYRLIDEHEALADNIEVRDEVLQYFGVFLCFLADKPNLIKKIIKTDENGYGVHCIEAYKDNKIQVYLIDDYILCLNQQPLFSKPYKMIYMWTCLIQKAWFKIRGNSAKRVQHNSPYEVFSTFLPLPIQVHYLEDGLNTNARQKMIKIFNNFDKSKQKGYILTTRQDPEHDLGLQSQKPFYLLDTFMHGDRRLFYIRNPCGQSNFRGIYNEIPEAIRNKLYQRQYMTVNSGNFLLDEDELLEQIDQIMIVDYIQGNNITNFSFNIENNQEFFIGFDIKHKGLLNLCVNQSVKTKEKEKKYCPLMYHVVRLNDKKLIGGMENEEGCFGVQNTYLFDNFTENIIPGKYLIRLKKKQYQKNSLKIFTSLVCYYKDAIKFDILSTEQSALKWKQFLIEQGKKMIEDQKGGDIVHSVCWLGDIIFIYVEKKNEKRKQIFIQVSFPELMNLQCVSHPEIKRDNQYYKLNFQENMLIIFEKIILTEETHIRKYHLEAF